ncbi:MAG: hypothetical protein KGL35_01800 [Bradyrhizobium sp.]|nr:hypothetical protein [Bradyrhizobium sp.]
MPIHPEKPMTAHQETLQERRTPDPVIAAINERLDRGDDRMTSIEQTLHRNTELTEEIARNTAGFVAFSDDLAAGTRFLCRVVKGIQFILKDVVEPFWKPAIVAYLAIYFVIHGGSLPAWVNSILKAMGAL